MLKGIAWLIARYQSSTPDEWRLAGNTCELILLIGGGVEWGQHQHTIGLVFAALGRIAHYCANMAVKKERDNEKAT